MFIEFSPEELAWFNLCGVTEEDITLQIEHILSRLPLHVMEHRYYIPHNVVREYVKKYFEFIGYSVMEINCVLDIFGFPG